MSSPRVESGLEQSACRALSLTHWIGMWIRVALPFGWEMLTDFSAAQTRPWDSNWRRQWALSEVSGLENLGIIVLCGT